MSYFRSARGWWFWCVQDAGVCGCDLPPNVVGAARGACTTLLGCRCSGSTPGLGTPPWCALHTGQLQQMVYNVQLQLHQTHGWYIGYLMAPWWSPLMDRPDQPAAGCQPWAAPSPGAGMYHETWNKQVPLGGW